MRKAIIYFKNVACGTLVETDEIEKIVIFKSSAFVIINDSFLNAELKAKYADLVDERINRIKG